MSRFRIATFNLENLDDSPGREPGFATRLAVLKPQLQRLEADILCLQEVNAQREKDHRRSLRALEALLADTAYAACDWAVTRNTAGDWPRDVHNLVILSRHPIRESRQYLHDFVDPPGKSVV